MNMTAALAFTRVGGTCKERKMEIAAVLIMPARTVPGPALKQGFFHPLDADADAVSVAGMVSSEGDRGRPGESAGVGASEWGGSKRAGCEQESGVGARER
eukprot:360870-Chlamydomonas_euryale.AAC.13